MERESAVPWERAEQPERTVSAEQPIPRRAPSRLSKPNSRSAPKPMSEPYGRSAPRSARQPETVRAPSTQSGTAEPPASTVRAEQAVTPECTAPSERSVRCESSVPPERAVRREGTSYTERAVERESTVGSEPFSVRHPGYALKRDSRCTRRASTTASGGALSRPAQFRGTADAAPLVAGSAGPAQAPSMRTISMPSPRADRRSTSRTSGRPAPRTTRCGRASAGTSSSGCSRRRRSARTGIPPGRRGSSVSGGWRVASTSPRKPSRLRAPSSASASRMFGEHRRIRASRWLGEHRGT